MKKKIAAATLAVAAVAALTLASLVFGKSPSARQTSVNGPDVAALATARANIGELRRARVAGSDALASGVATQPILADGVVDMSSSRLVRHVGRPVWLTDSMDGRSVCEVTAGALACPPVSEIVERGLSPVLVTRAGEPVHVSGIAADGVKSVDVVFQDGSVQTANVTDNLFTRDVPNAPRAVRWVGPSGPESYEFPPVPGR